jgi:poly-gamma-glutamate capsule biosynthesis protein CapA/YwtB (metallophosphatase superfamily)
MIDLAFVGDLVLDEPDADYWLSGIAPALLASDLAIGHLEVPHSASGREVRGDVPAPGAPVANVAAIARAGIGLVSTAGNHMADCGPEGISETLALLDRAGIAHAGAGPDLAAARRPAVVKIKGRRIALLSYNCVGPEFSWAGPARAGCAYLPTRTVDGSPVTPSADLEGLLPMALEILREDIASARAQGDFVIVALHQGRVHTPVLIMDYELQAARAAIDLGADAVVAHHAHIIRGISRYRGKPVFHGLGNGCVVTSALSPDQDHSWRREWALRRQEMFGFEPDPAYRLAPFHPDAVNAFIGHLALTEDGTVTASIRPVFVEAPGRPVLADGTQGRTIADYVERITREAGLPPIRVTTDYRIEQVA